MANDSPSASSAYLHISLPASSTIRQNRKPTGNGGFVPDESPTDNGGLDAGAELVTDKGLRLPAIAGYRWERKADCIEFWQSRNGRRVAGGYVGRIGKRLLSQWEALSHTEQPTVIASWVEDRCGGKGATHADD